MAKGPDAKLIDLGQQLYAAIGAAEAAELFYDTLPEGDAARADAETAWDEANKHCVEVELAIERARATTRAGAEVKVRLAHYMMRAALAYPTDVEILRRAADLALDAYEATERVYASKVAA